jgi:hypothetical protein
MKAQIALYKGPASGFTHKVSHWVTCFVLSLRELEYCRYSHAELVIDGVCYSSSVRDGGVRSKVIDLNSGKWDLVDLHIDPSYALSVFMSKQDNTYDWSGAIRWGLPFLKQNPMKYYCFEIIAEMLGLENPSMWTALDLRDLSSNESP